MYSSAKTDNVLVYPTDNFDVLEKSISHRKHWFTKDLKDRWQTAQPKYTKTAEGEDVIHIYNFEVMGGFQKPYMHAIANKVITNGGHILNVGFGLGLVDTYVQKNTKNLASHHIIELNETILENAEQWKKDQPQGEKVQLHKGNWRDVLSKMDAAGIVFDGVVYDAYPLDENEMCRDVVDFIDELLKRKMLREKTGLLSFYFDSVNGFGNTFQAFLLERGASSLSLEKVSVQRPNRDLSHWQKDFFLAPLVTGVHYQ